MRVKCRVRPVKDDFVDNQLTPGKFYNVASIQERFGSIYYTVVGDDGIEVERPARFFTRPLSKRKRLVRTSDGRLVNVRELKRSPGRVLAGKCTTCRTARQNC